MALLGNSCSDLFLYFFSRTLLHNWKFSLHINWGKSLPKQDGIIPTPWEWVGGQKLKREFGGDTVVADVPLVPSPALMLHHVPWSGTGTGWTPAKPTWGSKRGSNQLYSNVVVKKHKSNMAAVMDHGSGKAHSWLLEKAVVDNSVSAFVWFFFFQYRFSNAQSISHTQGSFTLQVHSLQACSKWAISILASWNPAELKVLYPC